MSSTLPTTSGKTVTASSTMGPCHTQLTLFVPTARRALVEALPAFGKALALSGGWTTRHVVGGWIDPEGVAIVEPVDEHVFLVPFDKAQAVQSYLRQTAEALLHAGEQAVLLVVGGAVQTTTYTLKG